MRLNFEVATPGGHSIYAFIVRFWWALLDNYHIFRMFIIEFSSRHRRFDWRRNVINSTKSRIVAVVSGGSGGIGAELVKKFLQSDIHVIIGCRDIAAGYSTLKKIRRKGITTGTAEVIYLDLMSKNSVKEFAYKILTRHSSINILINNAGVMVEPYTVTVDGFEQHFQVNFLSHFLLTYLLLNKLKASGSHEQCSRIVNVSSVAHYGGNPNFSDLQMSKFYSCHKAYMDSKFLQIVFSNYLDSRLQAEGMSVRSYSVHPGIIDTNLWDQVRLTRKVPLLNNLLLLNPEQGADTIAFAALSSHMESKGGILLSNSEIMGSHPRTYDTEIQRKMWQTSCKYLSINDGSFDYYNCNESNHDNDNIVEKCFKTNPSSFLETPVEESNHARNRGYKLQQVFPFNSRYFKAGTHFCFHKLETLRSLISFHFNYK